MKRIYTNLFCFAFLKYFLFFMVFLAFAGEAYAQKKYKVTYYILSSAQYKSSNFGVELQDANGNGIYGGPGQFPMVGTVTGSYETEEKPTSFRIYGLGCANGTSSTEFFSTVACEYFSRTFTVCGNITFNVIIKIQPVINITATASTSASPLCPSNEIYLTATSGFSQYKWTGGGISRTTTGNSTTIKGTDINFSYYFQNSYFTVLADGCESASGVNTSASFVFSAGNAKVTAATPSPPRCNGGSDGKIEITAINRALVIGESIKYTLRNEAGTHVGSTTESTSVIQSFSGVRPGSYTILAETFRLGNKVSQCGTPEYYPVTVPDREKLALSANIVQEESCPDTKDGQVNLTASGGVIPYEYKKRTDTDYVSTNVFSNLPPATYTFDVKDANGCTEKVDNITISPAPSISITTAYVSSDHKGRHVSCNINSIAGKKDDGAIKIEASGGTGALSYSATGLTYSKAYATTPELTGLYADTYTIKVKDTKECEVEYSPPVVLTPPPAITYASFEKTDLECSEGATGSVKVVGASGGTNTLAYSIDANNFQTEDNFLLLSAGTYKAYIKDENGCVITTTEKEIKPQTAISISSVQKELESCVGKWDGSLKVSAVGGTGALLYSIDGTNYKSGETYADFINLEGDKSYTIYVKDANKCLIVKNELLSRKPAINGKISVANEIQCYGESTGAFNLIPEGGTAPYSVKWSTGDTSATINNLKAGEYSVTITDAKECSKTEPALMTQPEKLVLNPSISNYNGYGVRCKGDNNGYINIQRLGGTYPFTYKWSNEEITQNIVNLSAGVYAVEVSDGYSCSASIENLIVTEPDYLTASVADFSDISCYQFSDGIIQAEGFGGAGGYQFSLDNVKWQTENVFKDLKATGYTIYTKDKNECVYNFNKALVEPTPIKLSMLRKEETTCGNANGLVEINSLGGSGLHQYAWIDGGNLQIGNKKLLEHVQSGAYTLKITDEHTCEKDTLFIFNDSDGPQIKDEDYQIERLTCFNSQDGSISIKVTEGNPPYRVLWKSGEESLMVNNLKGGSHSVEVRDAKNCLFSRMFDVPYPSELMLSHELEAPSCTDHCDGYMKVTASGSNGGYSYIWNNGKQGDLIEDLCAGKYTVLASDEKGCKKEMTITLENPAPFIVDIGDSIKLCEGQFKILNPGVDNATYKWTSTSGFTSDKKIVEVSDDATYTVTVTTEKGCVDSDDFRLIIDNDLLAADFLMSSEAYVGDTVVLVEISYPFGDSFSWVYDNSVTKYASRGVMEELIFNEPGVYNITLNTALAECKDNVTKQITIYNRSEAKGNNLRLGYQDPFIQEMSVFPNPTSQTFTTKVQLRESGPAEVSIVYLLSNMVAAKAYQEGENSYKFSFDLDGLKSGVYLVVLKAGGETSIKRLLIVK